VWTEPSSYALSFVQHERRRFSEPLLRSDQGSHSHSRASVESPAGRFAPVRRGQQAWDTRPDLARVVPPSPAFLSVLRRGQQAWDALASLPVGAPARSTSLGRATRFHAGRSAQTWPLAVGAGGEDAP
jgi:hypothetical protein